MQIPALGPTTTARRPAMPQWERDRLGLVPQSTGGVERGDIGGNQRWGTSSFPSYPRMPRFKKSNKTLSAFQRIASLGIPTHIAMAPLGLGAELDLDNGPEGAFHPASSLTVDGVDSTIIGFNNGGGSRISLLERIVENQQTPTPEITTTTPGGGSGIPGKCIHLPLLGFLLVILIIYRTRT